MESKRRTQIGEKIDLDLKKIEQDKEKLEQIKLYAYLANNPNNLQTENWASYATILIVSNTVSGRRLLKILRAIR